VRYLEPPRSFRDQLIETIASEEDTDSTAPQDAFALLAGQPQRQLASALVEVRSILSGPSIQARCLECPGVAPARLTKSDLSLLGLIREWLS